LRTNEKEDILGNFLKQVFPDKTKTCNFLKKKGTYNIHEAKEIKTLFLRANGLKFLREYIHKLRSHLTCNYYLGLNS
jgi:hypothetical protein